ncbi:MAG TPA: helix-turn-helix domain-containing protein, partial [Pseudonocardiaceae bacterium]|nr:helix-turn-helix domain-containing protein [Pseudonocardiaceae bacterium]
MSEEAPTEARHPWVDSADEAVVADTATLQALAHPLRIRLLGLLRLKGPSTATKLAGQVGESSGLTSYHLRSLASVGLITDADQEDLAGIRQTGGRERWWKAAHQFTSVPEAPTGDVAAAAVRNDYVRTALASYATTTQRWLGAAQAWPRAWREAAAFSDLMLQLTPDEAVRMESEITEVIGR